MYRSASFHDTCKKLSNEIINRERQAFRPYYEAIIKFIRRQTLAQTKEFAIAVSGEMAINAFVNGKVDIDQIVRSAETIVVYTDKPDKLARELAMHIYNAVTPTTPQRDLMVSMPIFVGDEYIIRVITRALVNIRILGEYRKKNLIDLIRPTQIDGIMVINPEILLINTYRLITSVDDDEERQDLIEIEKKLFERFMRDVKKGKITGSADRMDIKNDFPIFQELRKSIGSKLMEYGKSMVVGPQAIKPTKDLVGIQYVTCLTDEEIRDAIKDGIANAGENCSPDMADEFVRLISELAMHKITLTPQTNNYSLSMPVDFRLRRFRVVMNVGSGETEKRINLMDIFTAGQYDIIPRHSYTLLRFLFVDLWTILLIELIGDIAESTAARQKEELIELIIAAHDQLESAPGVLDDKKKLFGYYFDEGLARQISKQSAKRDYSQIIYPLVEVTLGISLGLAPSGRH